MRFRPARARGPRLSLFSLHFSYQQHRLVHKGVQVADVERARRRGGVGGAAVVVGRAGRDAAAAGRGGRRVPGREAGAAAQATVRAADRGGRVQGVAEEVHAVTDAAAAQAGRGELGGQSSKSAHGRRWRRGRECVFFLLQPPAQANGALAHAPRTVTQGLVRLGGGVKAGSWGEAGVGGVSVSRTEFAEFRRNQFDAF